MRRTAVAPGEGGFRARPGHWRIPARGLSDGVRFPPAAILQVTELRTLFSTAAQGSTGGSTGVYLKTRASRLVTCGSPRVHRDRRLVDEPDRGAVRGPQALHARGSGRPEPRRALAAHLPLPARPPPPARADRSPAHALA